MTKKNPFCISFGKQPFEYIDRTVDRQLVIDTFDLDPITDQLFLITGVRGSGKTVFMNTIAKQLQETENWIVLSESASSDITNMLYSDLYNQLKSKRPHVKDVSISIGGASISVSNKEPSENVITKIDELLTRVEKQNKKVLVLIDEVVNTPQMKEFSHMFQIEIGRNRSIFFLGTGLYENIFALSNEKDMTFLHRAPKIVLTPLNQISMAKSYQSIFKFDKEKAMKMAALTSGYSFAFQALGYVYWQKGQPDSIEDVLVDYEALLADASYSKIWSECSPKDQEILLAVAKTESKEVSEIRKQCNVSINYFGVYRSRLMKRGILVSPARGQIQFALPRFKEFILDQIW